MKFKKFIFICVLLAMLSGLCGCEAFVRKFTRKPKKENIARVEIVVAPEEYRGPRLSKEELYRQYLLYWKSWQDELITSLSGGANHKKQIGCVSEAIKNLLNLRALLNEEKQKKLDIYIGRSNDLKDLITKDSYGSRIAGNRQNAERIKKDILRDFSYNKIKDNLI
jgi:hypothetical protein